MINLNLISPAQKQEIKSRQIFEKIKNLVVLILILVIVYAIFLLLGRFFLQNNFNDVVEQTSLILTRQQTYKDKIARINQQIRLTAEIQALNYKWSRIFIELAKTTPNNIALTQLSIETRDDSTKKTKDKNKTNKSTKFTMPKNKEKIIILEGIAAKRSDFLILKENLINSEYFSEITSPFSNLLKEENIEFRITGIINLEKLK